MSDDNDERVVDALVAKRTSELATTPMRSVGYAEGYLAGLKAAREATDRIYEHRPERINRLTLKPGERDERGRRFLGWRIVWPNAGKYPNGGKTRIYEYPVAVRDDEKEHGCVRKRVYRRDNRYRKALRELVGALWNCRHGYNLTEEAWDVLCACHALLEEK